MRKIATVMLCFASLALGSTVHAAGCEPITADEAVKAEDARYTAQMSNDFAAMERLIAEDLVYIHSSSVVDNKKSYIESMRTGAVRYRVMRRSDVKLK